MQFHSFFLVRLIFVLMSFLCFLLKARKPARHHNKLSKLAAKYEILDQRPAHFRLYIVLVEQKAISSSMCADMVIVVELPSKIIRFQNTHICFSNVFQSFNYCTYSWHLPTLPLVHEYFFRTLAELSYEQHISLTLQFFF